MLLDCQSVVQPLDSVQCTESGGQRVWLAMQHLLGEVQHFQKHGDIGIVIPIPSDGGCGFSAVQPLQHRLPSCHGSMGHGGCSTMQYMKATGDMDQQCSLNRLQVSLVQLQQGFLLQLQVVQVTAWFVTC